MAREGRGGGEWPYGILGGNGGLDLCVNDALAEHDSSLGLASTGKSSRDWRASIAHPRPAIRVQLEGFARYARTLDRVVKIMLIA